MEKLINHVFNVKDAKIYPYNLLY